jgi:arginine N-succinyltransferase
MMVLRPVATTDLDALLELSSMTGFGLTTLPTDRELLAGRVRASLAAFERREEGAARGDAYLFVMEDVGRGRVVGTCGIVSKVGGFDPFYAYRIETSVHESKRLGVRKEVRALHLVVEHDGPCEIGSLFLAPDARGGGNGRLLSLARFVFMAEHPDDFDPNVIAEMRGVVDDAGHSVFWEAIGRHFFDLDFPTADYLSVVDKRFIADLMPSHPIYLPLLPKDAQRVIGKVHPDTEPALRMLECEGFHDAGMIDIFEGGPVIACPRDEIRALRECEAHLVAEVVEEPPESLGPAGWVVARPEDFRACAAPLGFDGDGGVVLAARTALALGVKVGERVRVLAMRPGSSE